MELNVQSLLPYENLLALSGVLNVGLVCPCTLSGKEAGKIYFKLPS
jgi:hypothetical protein